MDCHFRIAGGSRGEENPFRLAVLASITRCANRFRTATCETFDARKVRRAISLVAYDRIDFCSRDDVQEDDPAADRQDREPSGVRYRPVRSAPIRH